jgi:Spy/CpxP family protein refolding chaperone
MRMPASVRALLLLGVTLAAGVALGVSYERRRGMTHEMSGGHAEHIIQQITRELDLDSIQRDTVAKIFARRQSAIDSAWSAVQPHVHATIDSTLREIAGVLKPEQLAKYRRMVEGRHAGAVH